MRIVSYGTEVGGTGGVAYFVLHLAERVQARPRTLPQLELFEHKSLLGLDPRVFHGKESSLCLWDVACSVGFAEERSVEMNLWGLEVETGLAYGYSRVLGGEVDLA